VPILPLSTPRLIIRDFVSADIPSLMDIATHPRFAGYRQFRPAHIAEDVTSFILNAINFQKSFVGPRQVYRVGICLKDNPERVIGYCVFFGWHSEGSERSDQVGYFIHPDLQNKGYITEALQEIIKFYFLDYPSRNIWAQAHPDNASSIRVLEKLGFQKHTKIKIDVHGSEEPRWAFRLNRNRFST